MNARQWGLNVFEALKDLSDIDMQKDAWMGRNPNVVSSFDEVLMVLYDDFNFLDYLEYYKTIKGKDEFYRSSVELLGMIDNYEKKDNDELILQDPKWIAITIKAKEIVPLLSFTGSL